MYAVQELRLWEGVGMGLEYWFWQTAYLGAPTGRSHRLNLHTSLHF
ncbi:MAG: hypothetical protein ABEL76_12840 [Bradymonadaceae bacterium]